MDVFYTYVTDDHSVGQALETLKPYRRIGFDCETIGLDPTEMDFRLRLVQIAPKRNFAYLFDVQKLGQTGRKLLRTYIEREDVLKMGHNIKFDAKAVKWDLGVQGGFSQVRDTMLEAQLCSLGHYEIGMNLKDVAMRYTNHFLEKESQLSNWARPSLTEKQLRYAAVDSCVLFDVCDGLQEDLAKYNLFRVALLENQAVEGVAQLELNGVHLDRDAWMKIYDDVLIEWAKAKYETQTMMMGLTDNPQGALFVGAPTDLINLNSPQKVIAAMLALGVPVPENPRTGRPTMQRVFVEHLAYDFPVVAKYLEFRLHEKARSSYGPSWIERINDFTGRIHAEFKQIGAQDTGRMSCSNPNLQQPPKDARYRACFTAEPGNLIIAADYSQFELRILADYCRDPEFMRAFIEGRDLHYHTAHLIFEKPIEQVTAEERQMAKNNNFADVYGATAQRFALMAKIALALAERIQRRTQLAFPVKTKWLERRASEAITTLQSRTRSGRLVVHPTPSNEQERKAVGRNGRNMPIQGTNADVLKRGVKLLNDQLKGQTEVKLIHLVHDEFVLEAPANLAQDAEKVVRACAQQAGDEYVTAVPVVIESKIGTAWTK